MDVVRVDFIRRAETDCRADVDDVRLVLDGLRDFDGFVNRFNVVAIVHDLNVPAVGFVTLGAVFGEGDGGVAFDRNMVVVVQVKNVVELQMAGQRRRFARDAFHQIAVGDDAEDCVVDDLMSGAVEIGREIFLGHRHANPVGETLAQRAGRRFDAVGVAIFAMARTLAAELAEVHQIAERDFVAGHVQQTIKEHAGVARGENEAVAVGPI